MAKCALPITYCLHQTVHPTLLEESNSLLSYSFLPLSENRLFPQSLLPVQPLRGGGGALVDPGRLSQHGTQRALRLAPLPCQTLQGWLAWGAQECGEFLPRSRVIRSRGLRTAMPPRLRTWV